MENKNYINLFLLLNLIFINVSYAHDTTHIHPLITKEIMELVKTKDNIKAYQDIYEDHPNPLENKLATGEQFLYWGTDYDESRPNITESYLLDDQIEFYNQYNNVIDGVVQEDVPASKAEHHFYQANSGIGLNTALPYFISGNPSANIAMSFFNQSIDLFGGYSESTQSSQGAKNMAFFVFGQALHHVEDMSSPAHIHNDVHLTVSDSEKDDYEGWYLPLQKTDNRFQSDLSDFFSGIANIRTLTNPWNDIWGILNSTSMVQTFHIATTYQATLEYPVGNKRLILDAVHGDDIIGSTPTPAFPQGLGELSNMFPCANGANDTNCLHWQEDTLDELAHWTINAVGDFQHQFTDEINANSWWPIEIENNPDLTPLPPMDDPSPDPFPNPFSGDYYLEQLALDDNNIVSSDPLANPVVPVATRGNIFSRWHVSANPTTTNNTSLMEVYARSFLSPTVEFGAGFTEYWYDIANTPPYLKSVKVSQKLNPALSSESEVYKAEWVNQELKNTMIVDDVESCGFYDLLCSTKSIPYDVVNSRIYYLNSQAILHIHANEDITLELTFNEPIKQITQLRFGNHQSDWNCEVTSFCVDIITPTSFVNGQPPSNVVPSNNDRVWSITVPKSQLTQLNGKVRLNVAAIDKNNHRDGQGGITGKELDTTPDTPAKRNLFITANTPQANNYPWHNQNATATDTDEIAANISFSYDPGVDINHTLLFDTVAPTGSISVDVTLPSP